MGSERENLGVLEEQLTLKLSGGTGGVRTDIPLRCVDDDGIIGKKLSDNTFFGASYDPTCMRRGLGMYPSSREHSD